MTLGWLRRTAALVLCLSATGAARAAKPPLVYDGEFGGYVPIVSGIERPDLVVKPGVGRVPESARIASRRAFWKRLFRRTAPPEPARASTITDPVAAAAEESRHWLRRHAVTTNLWVLDHEGLPVVGARVFRTTDPSFYPLNIDESGARLFGALRFLPYPFPRERALQLVMANADAWADGGFAAVMQEGPRIDQLHNPWARGGKYFSAPPIEFVGMTGPGGLLQAVSGVFDLRDDDRFPGAVVPGAVRIGYIVLKDGFQPAIDESRHERGGAIDDRTVILLADHDVRVAGSADWAAALARVEAMTLDAARPAQEALAEVQAIAARLDTVLQLVDADVRDTVRAERTARLLDRAAQRAAGPLRLALLHAAADATNPPAPVRLLRLAGAVGADEAEQAEVLCRRAIEAEPALFAAYGLHDALLKRRHATYAERSPWMDKLLVVAPFDRQAHARKAEFLLDPGHEIAAFEHLRYTWAATPGLGGDRALAVRLADYYWRLGLTAKAGAYLWMLTGRPPEDPSVRAIP